VGNDAYNLRTEELQRKWQMEKRQFQRRRTLLNATALFNDGQFSFPCNIRDISEGGMKLNISDTFVLPDTFELHVPSQRALHQVRLRWRRAEDVGVAFCGDARSAFPKRITRSETEHFSVLEEEVIHLHSLLADISEDQNSLRSLFRQTVKRLREAEIASEAGLGRIDIALNTTASNVFDVFDDERMEWQGKTPA
jgi:hypothetical protein